MIRKILTAIRKKGLFNFLKMAAMHLGSKLVAVPIVCGIILISPLIRIRFIQLFSSRIGHYSFNTEAILCALDLKLENDKNCKTLFYNSPGEPICNTQLHHMWKREIPFFPSPSIAIEIDKLLMRFGGRKYQNDALKKIFEPGGDGRDRWELLNKANKCHLAFLSKEKQQGKMLLKELGVPEGSLFVCLLVRDSQYLNSYMPSTDWSYHDYRDADINSYQMAAQYLADQGYYVIRMGKMVKDPFLLNHPRVIDYANSKFRSDFLDIYLSANCFFYISTCSGLDSVARVFRKPLVITNLGVPDFDIWHPWNLFIPKKILNTKNNEILTFKEMNHVVKKIRHRREIPQILKENSWRFVDNTPTEITEVVKEMVSRVTDTWQFCSEDEKLQEIFWRTFPKYFNIDNLPGLELPICEKITMKIGSVFLRNNLSLLTDTNISQADAI